MSAGSISASNYTVNGYVALANGDGGDVTNCPTSGTTTGLSGLEVMRALDVSETDREKICFRNALKLFGLDLE